MLDAEFENESTTNWGPRVEADNECRSSVHLYTFSSNRVGLGKFLWFSAHSLHTTVVRRR